MSKTDYDIARYQYYNTDAAHGQYAGSVNGSVENVIGSLINRYTGADLTGAEKAANAFTKEMSDTSYQRGVLDMQAAGLNPALMYGNGASGASSNQSVSPSSASFGELVNLLLLPKQLEQLKANIGLTNAEKDAKVAETESKRVETQQREFDLQFARELKDIRKEAEQRSSDLTAAQQRFIYKNMEKLDAEIGKLIAETSSEEERKNLIIWQTAFQKASAEQIEIMRPYEIAFKQAATQAQKAAAAASYANAAYQNALLSSGQIDLMCENLRAEIAKNTAGADSAKADAFIKQYQLAIKTGNIEEFMNQYDAEYGFSTNGRDFVECVFAALNLVSSTIGNVFPKL